MFGNLFKKKKDIPEAGFEDERGDYSVKKNKTLDNVMKVVAVLAAFALWAYVFTTTRTTDERTFNLISIEERNAEYLASEYDLVVQSTNIDTINVTLMGNRSELNALEFSDVKAYVNLQGITGPGEYTLEVLVDIPKGFTCVDRTVTQIDVSVDRSTEKTVKVDSSAVVLSGWTLETGYSFGEIGTNLSYVTLKGTSRDLDKVAAVNVKTGALGNVTAGLSSVCQIQLLDSSGNILSLPGVQVIPDVESVQAYVTVYKEKRVPLAVTPKYGLLDSSFVSVSPSSVIIKGEPSAVDSLDSIILGEIDEKAEKVTLKNEYTFDISASGLTVTDSDGNPVNRALVTVDQTGLAAKKVTGIPLYSGEKQIGTASVKVIAIGEGSVYRLMTDSVSGSDLAAYTDESSTVIAISIGSPYGEYIYEYGAALIEEIFPDEPPVEGPADPDDQSSGEEDETDSKNAENGEENGNN